MDKNQALQNLLNGSASEDDIELLMRLLASGEIFIGGNVNQSVIIIGSGNTVELPPAALDRLNARPILGNLDRDLTGEEIAAGLRRLDKLLPNRAPVLRPHYKEQVGRLRPTLKTEIKALSESARRERLEALAAINSICIEALDVSFNGWALGEAALDYDSRSPFRGLESFRPEDSEFFFGREALTHKLVAQIQAHPFLAVLGASGSGKSSLVMAGVIPALDSDYAIFRPGTHPLGELESARGKSLIVVDQFEELFTLTRDVSTRKDFIARLLDESSRARIILTLRSDFLGEVGVYRTLSSEIQNHLEIIPPMDLDELRRAMEGQAGMVGLRFEADLSQQILDDVEGEPGAMPLLQHALWELWNRRHGRNLRASEYRAFGGVKHAITSTAEKVYADCSKLEQDQLRDIFLRLTRLDEGDEGRDTRRRVPLGDLIPFGHDAASIILLLDNLANVRLIVKTVNEDKTEVEVAHEALIRHWERLRLWLNEDRDALRLRESVSEDARRWENTGRDESLLNHRGGRLDDSVSLSENLRYELTAIEHEYIIACVTLRDREQHERKQSEERIQKQLERLSALHNIDNVITASTDLSSTFEIFLREVGTQLKVDAAAILLFNNRTSTLEYVANRGFQNTKLRADEGYAERVVLDRQIIYYPDLTKTENKQTVVLSLAGENFIAYVGSPLIAKGRMVGVLEVFHRSLLTPDLEWFDFLKILAGQVAIAIDNAELFENLQRSNLETTLAYDATIEGWSRAMELRDRETEGHTQRVTSLTLLLARQIGITDTEIVHIRRGSLLHDIGKMGISDSILHKPDKLTAEEWNVIRRHPTYAYEMLRHIQYLEPALDIPYCHHERWDGTGYPRRLQGEQIPLAARIFAIMDVYDILISDRSHRKSWSKERTFEYIRASAGTHFDPEVVEQFFLLMNKET